MLIMLEELEDAPEAIGARLQRIREILGLKKKEFAEKAGISEQAYGPWENARRQITYDGAKKIRKTYNLSLEFIYFGKIDDLPHKIAKEL